MMPKIRPEELDRAREIEGIVRKAADIIEWPEELDEAMREQLGPRWFSYVLMGIISRESRFWMALQDDPETPTVDETGTPGGVGDHGHGRGALQIDDRSHRDFIRSGNWKNLMNSLNYAVGSVIFNDFNTLADNSELFADIVDVFWASVAAYNCGAGGVLRNVKRGRHYDYGTTGRDYSADVRGRARIFRKQLGNNDQSDPTPETATAGKESLGDRLWYWLNRWK